MPEAVAAPQTNGVAAPPAPALADPARSGLKRDREQSADHRARMAMLEERLNDESEREYAELREKKTLEALEADARGDKSAKARAAETEAEDKPEGGTEEQVPASEGADAAETPEAKQEKERREKFDKTVRAEAKIVRREQEVGRRERELEARTRQLENERAQHAAVLDGAREFVTKIRDPGSFLKLAEEAGVTPERMAAWLRDGSSPERVAATRAEQVATAKTRELEQRLAQMERQARSAGERAAEAQFLAHVHGNEAKLDAAVTVFSDQELIVRGNEIASLAQERGLGWGYPEVAEALNELAEQDPRYERIRARLNPGGRSTEVAAQGQAPPGRQAMRSGTTLTNEAAAQRASVGGKVKIPREDRLRLLYARMDRER